MREGARLLARGEARPRDEMTLAAAPPRLPASLLALWMAAAGCGNLSARPQGTATDAATRVEAGATETDGATSAADGRSDSDAVLDRLPNVLVLLTDDQRFNTVHALGNPLIRTPAMDRLAYAGTSFSQAGCHGGINGALCITSRAALMTGRTINHLDGAGDVIPPGHTTLPELLRQAGYVTFATGKWHSDRASFARIFDQADNVFFGGMHFPEDGGHEHPWLYHFDPSGSYPAEAAFQADKFSSVMYADAAIAFIKAVPADAGPFLAYVAFTAPHDPRTPPAPFDGWYSADDIPLPDNFLPEHPFDNGELHNRDEDLLPLPRDPAAIRKEIAAYYGMISEVDAEIGRILDTLAQRNLLDRTIVVFAGDNGLALGAHGLLGKQNLYEESMRVPLILAGPGIAANAVDTRYAYLSDLLPTVASLLGLAPPATSEGSALLGARTAASPAHAYHQYREIQRGIRSADHWKLIGYRLTATGTSFDRLQLFDLNLDPDELDDLSAQPEYQGKLAELQSLLLSERMRNDDPLLAQP
jgi:arylsulfatase A-like enzyme